jgi:hypothetical protein
MSPSDPHINARDVPDKLVKAMARVKTDLCLAGGLPIQFQVVDPGPYANREVLATISGTVTGLFVEPTATQEEMTVALADQLQDAVIEVRHGAVPKCPEHEHPLTAVLLDGKARWICPAPHTAWTCLIGNLPEAFGEEKTPGGAQD